MPRSTWIVRAGAASGEIVAALRDAYGAQPGALAIAGVTLNPLEVVVIDDPAGRSYRVPVMIDQASGAFNFAAPIPADVPGWARLLTSSAPAAGRGVSASDQQRMAPGKVTASREDADYQRMFGPRAPQGDDGGPEYRALFGTVEQGQRAADSVQAAARKEVAALTDDQLFERMFGPGKGGPAASTAGTSPKKPDRDPLAASAAGRVGKHGRGSSAGIWNTARRPYPPRA
jgi:hypothetical protein